MTVLGAAALTGATDQLALSIVNDRAVRSDAREGVWGKRVHVAAAPAGIAFVGEKITHAYPWDEVASAQVRRGSVVVKLTSGQMRTRAFRLVVDDVEEPDLSKTFARVIDEMRAGTFAFNGSAWFEHQNAHDRMRPDFTDQDDHTLPGVALGMWFALGLVGAVIVALALNVAQARGIPAGYFSVSHRASAIDPRVIIAAFALSSLLTSLILRVALGPQYRVWVRGVARGWQESGSRAWRLVVRQLGRMLAATQSAAIVMLLALLAFWPNIAASTLVGADGVRHEILLPFISLDEKWTAVTDISITGSTTSDLRDRTVTIKFNDGRELVAAPDDIVGGTATQLFNLATQWRKAAAP
jgi:uncharacterized membrane-anchored protein